MSNVELHVVLCGQSILEVNKRNGYISMLVLVRNIVLGVYFII